MFAKIKMPGITEGSSDLISHYNSLWWIKKRQDWKAKYFSQGCTDIIGKSNDFYLVLPRSTLCTFIIRPNGCLCFLKQI